MPFNWFDYILIAILLGSFIFGLIKGLIRQVIGISAIIIGLILAIYFYKVAAELLFSFISNKIVSYLLGFLVIFLAILIIGLITSFVLSKLIRGPLKTINHFLGGLFGLIRGALICMVIVFLLLIFPFSQVNQKVLSKSKLTPYCVSGITLILGLIPKDIKNEFAKNYHKLIERVKKDEKRRI
ncbi:MAG: CvpA family protein [Candidatus Aminicenantia bacterium]